MASAKEIKGVHCDGPASIAIPLVLGFRLEEMCQQRKRALDFSDPEGVHDMRVASRRTRSALRDFLPYLRKSKVSGAIRDIKRVADALGAVRDHDVTLIALEDLKTKAPPEVVAGIQELIDAQKAELSEHRSALNVVLNYTSLTQLRKEFLAAVEAAAVPARKKKSSNGEPPAELTYRELARSTTLDRLRELEKLSPSLYQPLKAKPLHKMRIAAKRLRYALELFGPCWNGSLSGFANQVAKLQTDLGELHDCDLWLERFGSRLARNTSKKGEDISEPERLAMIWLIGHLTKKRARHFRAALTRWHEWQAKGFVPQLTAALEKSAPPLRLAGPASPPPSHRDTEELHRQL